MIISIRLIAHLTSIPSSRKHESHPLPKQFASDLSADPLPKNAPDTALHGQGFLKHIEHNSSTLFHKGNYWLSMCLDAIISSFFPVNWRIKLNSQQIITFLQDAIHQKTSRSFFSFSNTSYQLCLSSTFKYRHFIWL